MDKNFSYEERYKEVTQIINELEGNKDDINIDEAIKKWNKAKIILSECKKWLDDKKMLVESTIDNDPNINGDNNTT